VDEHQPGLARSAARGGNLGRSLALTLAANTVVATTIFTVGSPMIGVISLIAINLCGVGLIWAEAACSTATRYEGSGDDDAPPDIDRSPPPTSWPPPPTGDDEPVGWP
jgi:hypothetical protein